MLLENLPSFSELRRELNSYYKYRIWNASSEYESTFSASKFDKFYKESFDNFIPGSGFSCAILCDKTANYSFSALVSDELLREIVDSYNVIIRPAASMSSDAAKTTYDHITAACNQFLASNIVHNSTEIVFQIGSNVVFCHAKPNIEVTESLLNNLQDTICFGIVLPFLCEKAANATEQQEYVKIANDFSRAKWTEYDLKSMIDALHNITSTINDTFPKKWCLLIALPYDSFDKILPSLRDGLYPYINRVIQVENYCDSLIDTLSEAIYDRHKLSEFVSALEKINTRDKELLKIHNDLLKVFRENITNLL